MGKSATSSKADTAVKLVLIFFISLLSFSVGTYVGKQVSDSDARQAALEMDYQGGHKVAQPNAHESHGDEATAPISDEEVASLTEEFMQAERKVASQESAHAEETQTSKSEPSTENSAASNNDNDGYTHHSKIKAKAHDELATNSNAQPAQKKEKNPDRPSTAAERVAHDKAPSPDPKKKREPSSVLPTVATTAIGKYTVQVASYATESEAKNQAAQLTSKGYSAFYVPAEISGKTWYRVSIGLFSDMKSASNYRTELLATQAVSSAIVQKIVK